MKLKILDLFSGLGGFSLGLERTGQFKTVAFCEIDKYCTLLLQKHWKGTKIYNDVKEITKEKFITDGIQLPDIITGGFPCQPFSVAGKQKGTSDDRHLWPEMFRIIQEFTPRWVVGENVKGITNIQDGMVFETVCTDLEGAGYEVRTFNIPAASVGAPHRRERMWIVANRKESMVNPDDIRLEQHNTAEEETSWWRTSTTFEPTGSKDMENARRTLQQGTELREKNEDEIRKGNANQHQRSGSPSESDVANTHESGSREREISGNIDHEGRRASETRREGLQSEDRQTRTDNLGPGSEDVANTQGERTRENDEGLRSGTSRISGRQETTMADTYTRLSNGQGEEVQPGWNSSLAGSEDVANTESSIRYDDEAVAGNGGSPTQEVSGNGSSVRGESAWWDFEPDVGRVAHGIPGRVYRLKGLGNSIIPQIAQEIGNAIIKAESEE